MFDSPQDVLHYVEDHDVRFIRLTFFDLFGTQKNISILPNHLESAFKNGVAIDASLVDGFDEQAQDLFLVPDCSTFSILPWRSTDGYVCFMICDIMDAQKKPYLLDARYQLKKIIEKMQEQDLEPLVASKLQFTLFKQDESMRTPIDMGTYLDVSPQDQGENIRREIMLTLEEMGFSPYKSFHQRGHGQNEIDFRFSSALRAADEVALLRWITRTLAYGRDMEADFSPMSDGMSASNGLQIQIKFFDENPELQKRFMAGILHHLGSLYAFLNPFKDSYRKFEDPRISRDLYWSRERYAPLRIPQRHEEIIEVRVADPRINPYLALSLIFLSGLDGVEKTLDLPGEKEIITRLGADLKLALEDSSRMDRSVFKHLEKILSVFDQDYDS